MKLLLAEEFLYFVENFRSVWFQGRLGGGKTSLAVILAAKLMQSGKAARVTTNFPCSFSEKPGELLYNAVNVVDETHSFISGRAGVDAYSQFLRKLGIFLLMPSVLPPHYLLTKFSVQRLFNGYFAGLPLWVYRWTLTYGNIREKGTFAVWQPHHIFPYYNTRQIPFSDGGIADAVDRTIRYERFLTYLNETAGKLSLDEVVSYGDTARQTLQRDAPLTSLYWDDFQNAENAPKDKKNAKSTRSIATSTSTEGAQGIIDEIQDALLQNQDDLDNAVRQIKKIARKPGFR